MDYEVRQQLDRLFSRKMLGSVLVGKFIGDYVAILTTDFLGTHPGYIFGIVLSISIFVYWDYIERKAQEIEDEVIEKQSSLDDYENG